MESSDLDRVEAQRLQLEENILKLRKSLRHWQTLETDYEGLKEEFLGLDSEADREECLKAARDFGAELVDEKELSSLLDQGSRTRRPNQVVDLLSRRVEYVSRNLTTIRKQLSDAEKKRNALLLTENSEHPEAAGLPLTEITEELDDNDQVVSAKLQTAADSTPRLVDVLKKAGVSEIVDKDGVVTAAEIPSTIFKNVTQPKSIASDRNGDLDVSTVTAEAPPIQSSKGDRSFEPLAGTTFTTFKQSRIGSTEKSTKGTDESPMISQHPDDTEEDAALRQEMLQYGLGEAGAIVAELDLEENASTASYEDDADSLLVGSDFDEDEDEDEDEEASSDDENGMSKSPVISDRYRRRMEELAKKLGMQGMQNLGQTPDLPQDIRENLDRPPAAEAARKAAIARAEAAVSDPMPEEMETDKRKRSSKKPKKKVAFADVLDIAPTTESTPKDSLPGVNNIGRSAIRPIGNKIIERSTPKASASSAPAPSSDGKTLSRFKAARIEPPGAASLPKIAPDTKYVDNRTVKQRKPGKIVEDTLVERPGPKKHSRAAPPDPDDIDEEMHRRQIASEYYMKRNRLIHQQGGFVGGGEEDNYGEETAPLPVEEDATGNAKKVSRFKAARMK